jgi:DNA polymerase III alpha subunit
MPNKLLPSAPRTAVRLGLRQIKGFREADAQLLMQARRDGYTSVRDLWLRSGISRAGMERLAEADAFRSIGLDRRAALWEVRALDPLSAAERLPLFAAAGDSTDLQEEPQMALPVMPLGEHVVSDYRSISLSLKAHPVTFLREKLSAQGIVATEKLAEMQSGRRVSVAGLVLVRQRPGTASGVIFATLEDETGVANIIVWPKIFERFRPIVLGARLLRVWVSCNPSRGLSMWSRNGFRICRRFCRCSPASRSDQMAWRRPTKSTARSTSCATQRKKAHGWPACWPRSRRSLPSFAPSMRRTATQCQKDGISTENAASHKEGGGSFINVRR